MNKQIFFIMLISTSALIHSMDKLPDNPDVLLQITHNLSIAHKYQTCIIRRGIASLSQVSKSFYSYYDNENTKQAIIRKIARYIKKSDLEIANALGCKKIEMRIKPLHKKAGLRKSFTETELADYWYLTSTISDNGQQKSVLIPAIREANLKKITLLIKAGINVNGVNNNGYPLAIINKLRVSQRGRQTKNQKDFLGAARLLLEAKADPDARKSVVKYTQLMWAIYHEDKEYAQLLLTFGANPKKLVSMSKDDVKRYSINTIVDSKDLPSWQNNAFSLNKEGWLKKMVDEIDANKEKQERK